MTSFAQRCGIQDAAREQAIERLGRLITAQGLELVRFAWCDLHGVLRGKTLVASAAGRVKPSTRGVPASAPNMRAPMAMRKR